LLVSVQSANEAAAALEGGAELLDVKHPARGSLGRPDPDIVQEVLAVRDRLAPDVPVSVALGELADWEMTTDRCRDWLPQGVQYAKLGLARQAACDWQRRWLSLIREAPEGLRWIAVAYADARLADAPELREVIEAALAHGTAGVLIDTWSKRDGRLFDHRSPCELADWSDRVRAAGRLFAIAGRLRRDDLPAARAVAPDIIAIRSAACRDDDRLAQVDAALVREFRAALEPPVATPSAPLCRPATTTPKRGRSAGS